MIDSRIVLGMTNSDLGLFSGFGLWSVAMKESVSVQCSRPSRGKFPTISTLWLMSNSVFLVNY